MWDQTCWSHEAETPDFLRNSESESCRNGSVPPTRVSSFLGTAPHSPQYTLAPSGQVTVRMSDESSRLARRLLPPGNP